VSESPGRGNIFSIEAPYHDCILIMASSPILFFATIVTALLVMMGEASPADRGILNTTAPPDRRTFNYTTVTGYFLQDDSATNATAFDYVYSPKSPIYIKKLHVNTELQTATNFGLINRTYDTDAVYDPDHDKTQWQRFAKFFAHLNQESGPHTQYKVLFMGRHGEGYHNVAESFYGTPAWNVCIPLRSPFTYRQYFWPDMNM
jgi:hypothetical protein